MHKKILALILVLQILLTCCACSNNSKNPNKGTSSNKETASSENAESFDSDSSSDEADNAVSSAPIVKGEIIGTSTVTNDSDSEKEITVTEEEIEIIPSPDDAYKLNPMKGGSDSEAMAMRDKILKADDSLNITGKIYYVSNKGDNKNDGLSPETPFKDLSAVPRNMLSEGDAVLLERGSVFRLPGSYLCTNGVTYGAYGEGNKPAVYGSVTNFAKSYYWKPSDIKNVWMINFPFNGDVGNIVFNHGEHGCEREDFIRLLEENGVNREIKIFATDIDTQAIEKASKGIFPESISEDISADRLAKYFTEKNDQYHISKEIRKMIIFAPHNMFSDPPFGRLDLICCRNVLIYFQPVLQKSMFAIFHSALKNGGYLFLGKSETASEYSKIFKPASIAEKIYIHRGEGKSGELMPPVFTVPALKPSSPSAAPAPAPASEDNDCMGKSTYLQFLEKFLPASVVIDARDTVTHFFGNYWDYLRIAPGKATFNFFSIVNEDLRLVTSTAINRCRAEHAAVTYTGISVDTPSGRRILSLRTQPLTPHEDSGPVAVLFLENTPPDSEGITEKYDINMTAARRIADLEHELQKSRSDLKASISNLETVNEELQAANEELLTANEELQSSNEELQSVNEELYTVNSEYQQKLDELRLMTNDLSNFLSSTMIGILFVDGKLNIRKFTEYIGREFQLMEHDIGRPIQIFAHSFPSEDIVSDADTVLQELIPIDREVVGLNGRFYTMRIAPYRTTDNSIRGLVITVIDSLGTSRTA